MPSILRMLLYYKDADTRYTAVHDQCQARLVHGPDHPSLPFRGVVAQIIGEINAGILGLVKPF